MALADIQEKTADERKREKRLVHFTNAVTKDFLHSQSLKSTAKSYKNNADYVTKSFLDYVFFEEHKEVREIQDTHVQYFMLEYAPKKLVFTTEKAQAVPEILSTFLAFLDTEGHIKNGAQLSTIVKENSRSFLELIPKETKKSRKTTARRASTKKTATKTTLPDVKVGRNDPCPCGSGKKYKKCCGRSQ